MRDVGRAEREWPCREVNDPGDEKRVPEEHEGTVDLAEEGREEPDQEVGLQLEHVGVEATVAVAMALNVEEELPPLAGLRHLRLADESERVRVDSSNPS